MDTIEFLRFGSRGRNSETYELVILKVNDGQKCILM